MPSHFAHQFGYDQLYVRNMNPKLSVQSTLFEGAERGSIRLLEARSFFLPSISAAEVVLHFKLLLLISVRFRF